MFKFLIFTNKILILGLSKLLYSNYLKVIPTNLALVYYSLHLSFFFCSYYVWLLNCHKCYKWYSIQKIGPGNNVI